MSLPALLTRRVAAGSLGCWRGIDVRCVCIEAPITYKAITFGFRNARKDYITAKYIERKYARKKHADGTAKLHSLCEAVKTRDVSGLLQAYADGVDLTEKIPLANGHVRVCFATFKKKI